MCIRFSFLYFPPILFVIVVFSVLLLLLRVFLFFFRLASVFVYLSRTFLRHIPSVGSISHRECVFWPNPVFWFKWYVQVFRGSRSIYFVFARNGRARALPHSSISLKPIQIAHREQQQRRESKYYAFFRI